MKRHGLGAGCDGSDKALAAAGVASACLEAETAAAAVHDLLAAKVYAAHHLSGAPADLAGRAA